MAVGLVVKNEIRLDSQTRQHRPQFMPFNLYARRAIFSKLFQITIMSLTHFAKHSYGDHESSILTLPRLQSISHPFPL